MTDKTLIERPDREQRHAMHFPKEIRDVLPAKDCWVCLAQERLEAAEERIEEMSAMRVTWNRDATVTAQRVAPYEVFSFSGEKKTAIASPAAPSARDRIAELEQENAGLNQQAYISMSIHDEEYRKYEARIALADKLDIELSIRLSNGHFETSMSAPLTDKESARTAFESWARAIESILPRLPRASEEQK